ncbi:MAG TPA: DEAD/DEAH box helicase, partial [Trueperaceae bacterium]
MPASPMPDCLQEYSSYHQWLTSLEDYQGQVASYSFFPPRAGGEKLAYAGRYAGVLEELGITPYAHQAEAMCAVEAGQNVVMATPTASGKSLAYQVPTLAALREGQGALYLFPTKALAHDQLDKLRALAAPFGLEGQVASYDGDTPAGRRQGVREAAGCLLTNPDMLHYGILPHHRLWARFLGSLELVVLDELHSYRGVMGTHVANILRRLLRLAEHYGASPRIVAASATIGNPAQHARNLTGREFVAVTQDEVPKAAREFIFWQPPELVSGPDGDVRRRSPNTEAADLAALFVKRGLKSIFFCNSRKAAELLKRYALGHLSEDEQDLLQ